MESGSTKEKESVEANGTRLKTLESIRPGVVIDGVTYFPPGWMYVLAFALRGFQWAIDDIASGRCNPPREYQYLATHGCSPEDNPGAGI